MDRRSLLRGLGATVVPLSIAGCIAAPTAEQGFEPLGFVEIAGVKEVEVADSGRTAYVATGDGYATIDISDPEDPRVLARREVPMPMVHDVNLDGDRLLVVGPANLPLFGDPPMGFVLVDVADPSNPNEISLHSEADWPVYPTPFPIHNCFLEDGFASLTGNWVEGNPMVTVDIAGNEPEEVGRWSLLDHDPSWNSVRGQLRFLHDLWIGDRLACLAYWNAGTWILDISNPRAPSYLGRAGGRSIDELGVFTDGESVRREAMIPPGNDHSVRVVDDIMVVGHESWAIEVDDSTIGGPSGINLWDISDPTNPRQLSSIDPPPTPDPTRDGIWTTAHNFGIADQVLYSSWYQGGVMRHDISDPTNPRLESWWLDPDYVSFWTAMPVPARSGSERFIVATDIGPNDEGEGLFTFPDRPGISDNSQMLRPEQSS